MMVDDVGVLDRFVSRTWSGAMPSRPRSTVAIVLYLAVGLGYALLATFEDGGGRRVLWMLFAAVFVMLGVTLAAFRWRQELTVRRAKR